MTQDHVPFKTHRTDDNRKQIYVLKKKSSWTLPVPGTIVLPSSFLPHIPRHKALKNKLLSDKALEGPVFGKEGTKIGVADRRMRA